MIKGEAETQELIEAMADLLNGKANYYVVPTLITASARALALECRGDLNLLSTLLLKFCRLLENEAADMVEREHGPAQTPTPTRQ